MAETANRSTPVRQLTGHLDGLLDRLTPPDVVSILLVITLVGGHPGWVRWALVALALPCLLRPRWLRHPLWWLAATAVQVAQLPEAWHTIDNHHYLMLYASGAVALAWAGPNPTATLKTAARWLIVGVFAFATLWKLLTPDFADGRLFVLLAHDHPALQNLVRLIDPGVAEALADDGSVSAVLDPASSSPSERLLDLPGVHTVAPWLASTTLVLEGLVALVFALPDRGWTAVLRAIALIAFAAATYILAPVVGFAWILLLLGLAQADPTRTRERFAYMAGYIVIPLAGFALLLVTLAG